MPKTVIITGTSSGIGKAAALNFSARGWQVVAGLKTWDKGVADFYSARGIACLRLDVRDPLAVKKAVREIIRKYKSVDVLVNNAGFGILGPFSAASPAHWVRQYRTNVFGLMNMTREIIPIFKAQNHGTLVNVSSLGGILAFPFHTLYNSSKWAVEGFSEALQYELQPYNIKIKVVEPGSIKTDFYVHAEYLGRPGQEEDNARFAVVLGKLKKLLHQGSGPEEAAKVIFRAATSRSRRLRYTAGANAAAIKLLHSVLPRRFFNGLLNALLQIPAKSRH